MSPRRRDWCGQDLHLSQGSQQLVAPDRLDQVAGRAGREPSVLLVEDGRDDHRDRCRWRGRRGAARGPPSRPTPAAGCRAARRPVGSCGSPRVLLCRLGNARPAAGGRPGRRSSDRETLGRRRSPRPPEPRRSPLGPELPRSTPPLIGMVKVKVLPTPTSLCSAISPPIRATMRRQSVSPSPVPSSRDVPARPGGRTRRSAPDLRRGIPMPSSLTLTVILRSLLFGSDRDVSAVRR